MKHSFVSTLETETTLTPHAVYSALAIDAALLELDDSLPTLDDEERRRVLDAAQTAAGAVLKLAQVPNDWIGFLQALRSDHETKLREELHNFVCEQLPNLDMETVDSRQQKAIAAIRKLVAPSNYRQLHEAITDLESANWGLVSRAIEAAFALGFQIAKDASPLIFEKMAKHIDELGT